MMAYAGCSVADNYVEITSDLQLFSFIEIMLNRRDVVIDYGARDEMIISPHYSDKVSEVLRSLKYLSGWSSAIDIIMEGLSGKNKELRIYYREE